MTNPYPNRVLTLVMCLLGLALVSWLGAVGLINGGADQTAFIAALQDLAGWSINAAGATFLAWLVLRGVLWRASEAAASSTAHREGYARADRA